MQKTNIHRLVKQAIIGTSIAIAGIPAAIACSNVFIHGNQQSVIARSMDFEFNSGGVFALGSPGTQNEADLTMNVKDKDIPTTKWTPSHHYMGQTWLSGTAVIDGINDAGVYVAYLYLPDTTEFPTYNKEDKRPALGVFDIGNFVLGNADSVSDALTKLKKSQIIANAVGIKPFHINGIFMVAPVHVVIRDKTGHSAVIEWQNGKTIIYDKAGPVMTNSPDYAWQVKHAQQYDNVQSKNTKARFNGILMNGSGFVGLPGDWTSPNRFARATQVLKHSPKPSNDVEARRLALSVLQTVQVPPGTNPAPTLWESISDLQNLTYFYKPMYTITNPLKGTLKGADPTKPWQQYRLKDIIAAKQLPKNWNVAISKATPAEDVKYVQDMMNPTE